MSPNYSWPHFYPRKFRIQTISHIHGLFVIPERFFSKIAFNLKRRFLLRNSNLFFTCSNSAAKLAFGPKAPKVIYIKNAIDLSKFRYSESKRKHIRDLLKIDDDCLTIGNVARLNDVKNLFFLIDVFAEILLREAASKLIFVSDGPLKNELIKYTKKKDIYENVFFLGHRDDIDFLLSAMDIFVMPSIVEGFGTAILEAQALGLKCFISDAIPSDVIITENVRKLSLSMTADKWASEIISDSSYKRVDMADEVSKSGFNSVMNIQLINKTLLEYKYKIKKTLK